MNRFLRLFPLAAAILVARAETPAPTGAVSYPDSAYAALGSSFIHDNHLDAVGWTPAQIAAFLSGARSAFDGRPQPFDDTARALSGDLARRLRDLESPPAPPSADLARLVAAARKQFGLQQSPTGLGYRIMNASGNSLRPRSSDTVIVSFTVTAVDGTKYPQLTINTARTRLSDLIPGLVEGIRAMTVDAHAVFLLPPALSFGDRDWPEGVAPGTPLLFFVTLHDVLPASAVR